MIAGDRTWWGASRLTFISEGGEAITVHRRFRRHRGQRFDGQQVEFLSAEVSSVASRTRQVDDAA